MLCPACSACLELLNSFSGRASLSWLTGGLRTSRPAAVRVDAPPPRAPSPQGHAAVGECSSPAGAGLAQHPQPDRQEQVTTHSPGQYNHVTASQKRHQLCLHT